MDTAEKARRLMAQGVNPKDIGNPQVRRFVENQNRETYKKQVAEVNALYQEKLAAGYTQAQAATSESAGYKPPVQIPFNTTPQNYTVSDGDTIDTIATKFNTTPTDFLAANPDLKNVRTGMVVNTVTQQPNIYQQYAPQYEAAGLLATQAPKLPTGGGAE
ncbi:MAG: LysM peptidoglycan-binding domain-containing protein, partial [Chloroflexota bacterium]|nr:LysM peptidoglycan-binding domain-containing protein [Chloroflexota bacterium]